MKLNKSCHVLVYFHEENQFSILRLKDVLKPTEFEVMDFSRWDKKKSIEVKWGNDMYPANLLQFGENKDAMENLIDRLVDKTITTEEIPIIQDVDICKQRSRTHIHEENSETVELQPSKRQKLSTITENRNKKQRSILHEVKENLEPQKTSECSFCEILKTEQFLLKKQINELAAEVQIKTEAADHYKKKHRDLKRKYREYKKKIVNKLEEEETNSDLVKIGDHLSIDKLKHALCRTTNFSKYTCDLLDVVFGRESLSTCVIKGIKGTSKKVLDPNYVADIQGHVASKFSVNVSLVRATIRNKLNSAAKAAKFENK